MWRYLDRTRPVALILGAVVHHIEDAADPAGIVAGCVRASSPGSFPSTSGGPRVRRDRRGRPRNACSRAGWGVRASLRRPARWRYPGRVRRAGAGRSPPKRCGNSILI
ncbi:SAM-dependent methyltransferase [Nocardia testacea]|uniref:SAM-dependent methyltransferase n=1 Tax=Nocardia testacea TaxID=248551 RepID=UPI0014612F18